MPTFRILPNTPLFFVRSEDEKLFMQNEMNRMPENYYYLDSLYWPYFPTFATSDNLFFQYRTDYEIPNIYLIKDDGTSSTLVSNLAYNYGDGRKLYQVEVPLAEITGRYMLKISAIQYNWPVLTFNSVWFDVVSETNLLKFSIFGSDSLNDPFIWGIKSLDIRIDAQVKKRISASSKTTYVDTDGNIEATYGIRENNRQLEVKCVPEWLQRWLDDAIQHDSFFINDIEYGTDSAFEYESTNNMLYGSKLKIKQKNYSNFTSDETLTGDVPIFETVLRTTGVAIRTTGLVNRTINN